MTSTYNITKQAEKYLEELSEKLEIPPSRYEQAERSYKSLGAWLHRDDSKVSSYEPDVHVQGSFRLGTVIKPVSDEEEYDVDAVCILQALDKSDLTQARLKDLLGREIERYRLSQSMKKPVRPKRRCWRLEYSDGAQFHMDIVPALPNGLDQTRILQERALDFQFAETAIAITDNERHPQYSEITRDWPRSNPRGYAKWFELRMGEQFTQRRHQILNEMRSKGVQASVEDIPTYRVRTPLQSANMILKRHRDIMFKENSDNKPISIILSTLSGHAYNGEVSISHALVSILSNMKNYIRYDGTQYIIENPTDTLENFADKWNEHPERAEAFFSWLEQAQQDFIQAASLTEHARITSLLSPRIGPNLTESVSQKMRDSYPGGRVGLLAAATAASSSVPSVSFSETPRLPKKPDGFA